MWYYKFNQIQQIHFEISNFCNAKCPECPREDISEIDPDTGINRFSDWIDTQFLSLDIIKKNINVSTLPWLQSVSFCGCFGDALTHPKLIEILEYLIIEFPKLTIHISTNGGLKTTDYWSRLAKVLTKSHYHEVIWGLDGLEDTNHLYRVNVKWNKVKANWQAFNAAGGNSTWQFIVFPHNHHQIQEAKQYAKSEGFTSFKTVLSMRYSNAKAEELPYEYTHPKVSTNEDISFSFENVGNDINLQPIYDSDPPISLQVLDSNTNKNVTCQSMKSQEIFLFSDGTVWPCSKLGAWRHPKDYTSSVLETATNARYINNLNNFSLEEIFNNSYFKLLFTTHKKNKPCKACVEECGRDEQGIIQTKDYRRIEKL